ncbi:HD domain-containing phosphohydrolase [Desulfogranum japonicum]|uniref:HD domain-containing phosphohydrolase n=1 Tax=Desulfogranum japonicum TaxID=231447 RepID=UPI00041F2F31|nr:HD domain-containing phosphohydrolase [Desulfogranum japonicum]
MESRGMRRLSRAISIRIALPALLTLILFIVSVFMVILPSIERNFMAGKRTMIKELTGTAWNVLNTYHNWELQGRLTREEAQRQAIAHIRNFRYGDSGRDYFWINDLNHALVVHPYRPDLEGTNSFSFQDPTGKYIFREFVRIAKEQGTGYVEYMWQYMDKPESFARKVGYIRFFEPWDWVLGTGIYLEEVYAQVAQIRKKLTAVSALFLAAAIGLALYSIRHTILADRVRVRIWEERGHLIKDLEKSREHYRSLVEATSDWILEFNHQGTITYSSPRIEHILCYKPEEITGMSLHTLCLKRDKPIIERTLHHHTQAHTPISGLEITCCSKDDQQVILDINAVPVTGDNGKYLVFRGVARDVTERIAFIQELRNSRDKLHASLEATVKSLASAAEKRDPYTAGHQQRVDQLACAIGRALGLDEERIEGLHFAAILHDIGKISLPAEYLAKPSALSRQEWAVIQCHTEVGYEILKNIDFPWPIAEIVYQHHEHLDGSGYPRGLHDEEILLEAKILTVADVVEAMSSHRPYRPALGMEKALETIREGREIKYYAEAVDACIEIITRRVIDFTAQTW